ncbi:NifB/NifX family molybdenum-iron cluster-binding protein [Natranaerobius thermophilus]|uniref:Dinitrogenase iron-molybdenum cofactor biosynthesis protein n=1 Tax=Natranaerobius thermophilus (strain ATCC BAA-1301 / DSM 18059 / JW/NM-WN-LF) TaxID=457570 RepID=B2A0V5_NATTJ|nr:NifB/NifX family molybdenum-iron cluster-binding protein [Natranaerobius thermophilus]ACB85985.1 Dinitrogenase iron-molybdenum cofactor biosynthesis protein [Natranaerobius thermophilus JW/NM-WN-LF]
MKVAVATEQGCVASHFGRCSEYTIAEIGEGHIENQQVILNPGHKPGFLPNYLFKLNVDCVISGGMGMKARNLFSEMGIETIVGVEGDVDEILNLYLKGELLGTEAYCDH